MVRTVKSSNTRPVILSADDDEHALFFLTRAFNEAGICATLTGAKDGTEVIAYLAGEGRFSDREAYPLPQLLLLDVNMPGRSGLDVLEYLQRNPQFQNLPAIILSASTNESEIRRAYERGCRAYVSRPAGFPELVELVSALQMEFFETPADSPEAGPHTSAFSRFVVRPENTTVN